MSEFATVPAADRINRLLMRFMELHEGWKDAPAEFDWPRLEALAQSGAHAYNEGAGPSFQMLTLDAVEHDDFHERFFGYLLDAGFDPFKLVKTGVDSPLLPVLNHTGLAEAALTNPCSARMHGRLLEMARRRFAPMMQQEVRDPEVMHTLEMCTASVPPEMLKKIAPTLAAARPAQASRMMEGLDEGRLSAAELIIENQCPPYG